MVDLSPIIRLIDRSFEHPNDPLFQEEALHGTISNH